MNQNWIIFIKLIYACIEKDKTNILTQYPHVGHENRCWFWEPQTILNMVVLAIRFMYVLYFQIRLSPNYF
jgi:hypothetical protein